MAVIRETLVLEDRFSAVFSSYLNLGRQIAANMRAATDAQSGFAAAAAESGAALGEMAGAGDRAAQSAEETAGAARKMSDSTSKAADHQNRMNRALRDGSSAANGLISRLKALAAAYVGLRSAQQLVNLSDTWTQTTARLDRMNDGRQTTPEAQDMIFHAAQRSRGDYQDTADMVSKLGTLAPDAFGSTAEVVAFAEQINKQFALAGTSAQGAQAAMLQLTQAMSSGVLRGEELNSVLEQAPTITQAIAKYMGVTIGELRELASEGQVTAQVVKAALFAAAEETNAAFEAVPLTFSQGWNMVKNEALSALRPALEQLSALLNSDIGRTAFNGLIAAAQMAGQAVSWLISLVEMGAQWVMDNWETVSTVLIGLAVGLAAAMVGSAAISAAAWIAANWPLVLIVGAIALAIYMARQMGATWEEVGEKVGGIVGTVAAFIYNIVADLWNLFAIFAEFLANLFVDPLGTISRQFFDTFDWILSVIESVAGALDAVFGTGLSNLVAGFRSRLGGWVDDLYGEKKFKIDRMEHIDYGDAWDRGSEMGRSVGRAVDNFTVPDFLGNTGGTGFDYNALAAAANAGITPALEGIGGDTKAIRNSVALSEEDMKLLVDLAEREYITNVNLTAQTPIINVSGQNSGDTDMDRRLLADAIRDILIEQAASHTDLAYT